MFTGVGTIVVEVEVSLRAGKGEGKVEVDMGAEGSVGERWGSLIRHFQPIFGRGRRRDGTTRKALPDRRVRPENLDSLASKL